MTAQMAMKKPAVSRIAVMAMGKSFLEIALESYESVRENHNARRMPKTCGCATRAVAARTAFKIRSD